MIYRSIPLVIAAFALIPVGASAQKSGASSHQGAWRGAASPCSGVTTKAMRVAATAVSTNVSR